MIFLFYPAYHSVHYFRDVVDVQSRRMEGTVGYLGSQKSGKGRHAAFADFGLGLYDKARRAHTDYHAVSSSVKRQSGFSYVSFAAYRARRQESSQNPFLYHIIGYIIGGYNYYPLCAAEFYPVFRYAYSLSGRCTSAA